MQTTSGKKVVNKKRRWIIAGVVVVVLVGCLFAFLTIRNNIQTAQAGLEAQTGDMVTAVIGDLSATASATGQIEAAQTANLSAQTTGIVQDVLVSVGDSVQAGDMLAQLDTTDLAFAVARMQQNLTLQEANLTSLLDGATAEEIGSAEAAVHSAQLNLEDVLNGPTDEEIAEYEANIRAQQAGVYSASASYNSTLDSVGDAAIAAAQVDVINAQTAYDNAKDVNDDFANADTDASLQDAATTLSIAQAALSGLQDGPKQGSVSSAAGNVSAAVASLEQTQANYDKLLAGATASQIAAAQATLAQAESTLDNLVDANSEADLVITEAGVEQARLALLGAEENLAKATIAAPFDGLITAVNITEGEMGSGTLFQIMSDDFQVILSVDEIDVGDISMGQEATITLETWPDDKITGAVTAIAPSANSGSSIVSYDVTLTLDESTLPILAGMTANAKLITSSRENVLVVPNAAITANRAAGTYTVNLVTGEMPELPAEGEGIALGSRVDLPTTEKVTVTIGLKDGDYTQILSGISEGDTVMIGELAVPTFDFGGGGGPFGGGGDE